MKTFSLQTLEQLIYDIELYLNDNTDPFIIEKLHRITDYFATIVVELESDYKLQESIQQFGDKRKKD